MYLDTAQQVVQPVKLQLRHYGNTHYKGELFKPICDVLFRNKPNGGLWASPAVTHYGWDSWAKENGYGDLSCYFDFTFEGIIFEIDSISDMENLPWVEFDGVHFISFEPLVFMGYDAIHLTINGLEETKFTDPKSLYGWDCETVLIMNSESILGK